MPTFASTKRLQRVSTAQSRDIERWREGLFLEQATGRTIRALQLRAAVDRWRFANDCRVRADAMLRMRPPRYRDAISRYYYAMYHSMRAAAYLFYDGDDHQEHRVLPGKTPTDFPRPAYWQNALKDARESRNQADYEAYPKLERAWRPKALALKAETVNLLNEAETYLVSKGCVF
jgi:uncharacterized protein (UPF0332 family)